MTTTKTYTIKQMADELGVYKMKVSRIISDHNVQNIGVAGKAQIYDQSQFDQIKQWLSDKPKTTSIVKAPDQSDTIALLTDQTKAQQTQIADLQQQVTRLTELLGQAQQLQMSAEQKLRAYEKPEDSKKNSRGLFNRLF
ncbi:hypothetical protein [Levilactobacillus bambusae]|uniref:Uncharacterized protein n=1 Tax=Levilactobacillus bambusae TaxID=2024736 RepID=A0A2V1MYF9_9LACO|nr:hypothetical protein [Levilactobacillus bambusae]PWF99802.1 hypothetical protein DCM90_07005 [Levilactobacillus bambusae]